MHGETHPRVIERGQQYKGNQLKEVKMQLQCMGSKYSIYTSSTFRSLTTLCNRKNIHVYISPLALSQGGSQTCAFP